MDQLPDFSRADFALMQSFGAVCADDFVFAAPWHGCIAVD
jgi:hypothetical protein